MSNERDEHDPPKPSDIEQAIETCTAAVVTELDDGKHDDLQTAMRLLIAIAQRDQYNRRKSAPEAIATACAIVDDIEFIGLTSEQFEAIVTLRRSVRLYGAVESPGDDECRRESKTYYEATRGLRGAMSPKNAILHAYEHGMRRAYRS